MLPMVDSDPIRPSVRLRGAPPTLLITPVQSRNYHPFKIHHGPALLLSEKRYRKR